MLSARLEERLRLFPAVALLGPRQVGKTTLARAIAETSGSHGRGARKTGLYLDLESPADQERLADAQGYLSRERHRLVVLDEIHRAPRLFQVLRGIIDERIRGGEPAGQFLLLGSASMDLLRQSGESLAGRIAYLELAPLDVRELSESEQTLLWLRGGFPRAFLAPSDADSAIWREDFIHTYLERDVPRARTARSGSNPAAVLDDVGARSGRALERRRTGQEPRRGRQDGGPIHRPAGRSPARAPVAAISPPTSASGWPGRPRSMYATVASSTRSCDSTMSTASSAIR